MKTLYLRIDVIRRVAESTLKVYRCLQLVPSGGYCVQSVDWIRLPLDDAQTKQFERQFYELLTEEAPEVRSSACSSLEDAIADFDREFDEGEGGEDDPGAAG